MSLRSDVGNLLKTLKDEYHKVEFSDKILDIVSVTGVILFLIGLFAVDLQHQFNILNIIFIMYPLFIGGTAATFRMKRRDKQEDTPKLLKEWLTIMGTYLLIIFITIIVALVLLK